jgi:hypothetical protein
MKVTINDHRPEIRHKTTVRHVRFGEIFTFGSDEVFFLRVSANAHGTLNSICLKDMNSQ